MPELTRRPLEWNDRAPVRVEHSRRIPAPVGAVWDAIADHASWPTWFTSVKEVVPGEVADALGGTRRVTAGPMTFDEEFIAWEPERRFAFSVVRCSQRGLRSMNEDVQLIPDGDDATTVSYVQAIDVPFATILRPIMRRALSKGLRDGLAGLEAHVTR